MPTTTTRWGLTSVVVVGFSLLTTACTGSIVADEHRAEPAPDAGEIPVDDPPSPVCESGSVVPVFHRLNRIEYQNSVNAALGIELALKDELPVDALVYGFDNNADVSMSATLMQKYLNAAQLAVQAALSSAPARAALIPCALPEASCARSVLERFLPRAFRRPVTAGEIDEHLAYMTTCASSPEAGIGCALQAALLSPKFLFRAELLDIPEAAACAESVPVTSSEAGMLANFALASRLSYWLVKGAPDDELFARAADGSLSDETVIAGQVERLLGQPASSHVFPFAADFASQWLQLAAVASAAPSAQLFPGFDDELRQAMQDESRLFFQRILTENLSALELVRTNFTYLNERLAEHYGIAGVSGPELRVVDTSGTLRGGILTQASYLTATSSSENTSIVLRAKWVLTNLLCEDLPAPPPGAADAVPAPDPDLNLTNRESLQYRTGNAPCNGCHAVMNPIGFGLEVFDPIGAERTLDHDKPIDASGELPGGLTFDNTEEMLALLKADARFPRCLTKKLLTHALGRGMEATCDSAAIDTLASELASDGYALKNHIVRIAKSDLFRLARAYVAARPEGEQP